HFGKGLMAGLKATHADSAVKRGIVALLNWCFFKQNISTCFCPVFRHSVSQTTGYALANR
ncbi:hypothetical protein ACUODJ_49685, partial [Escherichia sp. HC-CC]